MCRLSSCARNIPSQASLQAPREPGSTNTNVSPISPPVARDCSELVPTVVDEYWWNNTENPSIRFWNSGSTASGVTSRPENPVPPVVTIASIEGSATQRITVARIAWMSSLTTARSAQRCPSVSISDLSRAPAVSVSSVRVSETASTAIDSGVNGFARSSSDLNILVLVGWHFSRILGGFFDRQYGGRLHGCHYHLGLEPTGSRGTRQIFLGLARARVKRHRTRRNAFLRIHRSETNAAIDPHRPYLHPQKCR